jgi:hypothetical protein
MKIAQLFEDDQEPLMITILRNAMEKGKQVRVYYKGDGGLVKTIEWDPPAEARKHRASDTMPGNGASSFKTVDDRWVVIGDHNLEKLVLSKRVDKDGVEHLTLKQEAGRPIKEGMNAGREWVDKLDAEFKAIVTGAGWMLKRPPTYGLENGYFGGTLRATASAKRSLLNIYEQRVLIMKMLARKFIALNKDGISVTVAPYNVARNTSALTVQAHTTVEDIIDTLEDGIFVKVDGTAFDAYWSVAIPKDIVDHVTTEFSKALTGTQDADE